MAGLTKSKSSNSVKSIRFKDVPGLKAIPLDEHSPKGANIYNGTKHAGQFLEDSCRTYWQYGIHGEQGYCKNLHQAMRWIYLQIQQHKILSSE